MSTSRLTLRDPELTRERLVNPHEGPLHQRLIASKTVDLRGNLQIIPLEKGYDRIVPVDPTLTIARDRHR